MHVLKETNVTAVCTKRENHEHVKKIDINKTCTTW